MTKTISTCLWCRSKKLDIFAHRKDGVGILRCKKCGLYMVDTIPDDLEEFYYDEAYYNAGGSNVDSGYAETYDLMAPAFLFWQNALIEELNESHANKNFLEIGCATGNLLEIVRDNQPNLDIEGIDISKYAVQATITKGIAAKAAHIEKYKSKSGKDIIFSSETMEHIDDLKSFLGGVKDNLKDDGVFIFYVPSISVEDAVKEKDDYLRFNTNLEHLLHFTPDFLDIELAKFFNAKTVIQEFKTGYGTCVIGAVSRDDNKLADLRLLLKTVYSNKLPSNPSYILLKNIIVVALKFSKFDLANEALDLLKGSKEIDDSDLLLLNGLLGYHNGHLVQSNKCFEDYLRFNPGSQMAVRSLLFNERELSKIYQNEIEAARKDNNMLKMKASSLEEELSDLNASRVFKLAAGLSSVLAKARRRLLYLISKIPRLYNTREGYDE